MTDVLLHICRAAEWDATAAEYRADSLTTEGFIHLSRPDQVTTAAENHFLGQADLILLVIDPGRVGAPIRTEDLYGTGAYPHLYGPLPVTAVTEVIPFPSNPDGTFTLPPQLN